MIRWSCHGLCYLLNFFVIYMLPEAVLIFLSFFKCFWNFLNTIARSALGNLLLFSYAIIAKSLQHFTIHSAYLT